jgi:hypothetical protein
MKPRELGGALKEATDVWLWVTLNKYAGFWLNISKAQAREIIDAAKEDGVEVIRVEEDGGELFIGGDEEIEAEAALAEPAEEAEGEEEEDADEEDLEEEPAP